MALKDNLPKFAAEEKYTKEIFDAIQPEIDAIKLKLSKIILECCVSNCSSEGIKRFEKDYAIKHNENLSLDKRRTQIINKMLAKRKLTKTALEYFVKRNLNGEQFYISNSAEKYHFKIMIINKNLKDELYMAVYNARPAHITFEITLTKYEKRCNTFNCAQNTI